MNLNPFYPCSCMEKAKELLRTTSMKVAMVGEQVGGFANSSYFCRSSPGNITGGPESYRKGKQ